MLARLCAALLAIAPAQARTLTVGPDGAFKAPSAAAAAAADGDTVQIAAGEYLDCAVWRASRLTIDGPGAVLTDRVCDGKAIFVIDGDDVTITGLAFTRARTGEGNGAGIRAQGGSLTLRDTRFVNNQVAILFAANPQAVLSIAGSRFEANGACDGGRCVATLLVDPIAELVIRDSVFTAARGGALVQSAAQRTEITGSTLEDGAEGRATWLVDVVPGTVRLESNGFQKGARSGGPDAAILLRRGDAPGPVRIRGNAFTNNTDAPASLVRDWSSADPVLDANRIAARDTAIDSSGVLRNRASIAAHGVYDAARSTAGSLRRGVRSLLP